MEDRTQQRAAPGRRRRIVATIAGGGAAGALVLGLSLAALAAAGAETSGRDPNATDAPDVAMIPAERRPGDHVMGDLPVPMEKLRHGGVRLFGGPGIHGEFTTRKPDGGYQTLATQTGEVISVSSSLIEVRSEDGFTRKYTVDDKTRTLPGTQGIGDVKKGHTVRVMAVIEKDKPRALHVVDLSNLKERRGKRELPPEVEKRLRERRPDVERKLREVRPDMEKLHGLPAPEQLKERSPEMEKLLQERRAEMEKRLQERRAEMEKVLQERRAEMEKVLQERRAGVEGS
jgi:hypothetical protein